MQGAIVARRGGFERFVMSMAKEATRQHRISAVANQKRIREAEQARKQLLRDADRSRRDLAMSQREAERAARLQYLEDREAEAQTENEDTAARLEELANVLSNTLSVDDMISFDSLRVSQEAPTLVIASAIVKPTEAPNLASFLSEVSVPKGLGKLMLGAKKRYAMEMANADAKYRSAMADWEYTEATRLKKVEGTKSTHAREITAFSTKVAQRDAEVDAFKDGYFSAEPDAVVAYNTMVLERSVYPESFPQNFSVAYASSSKQLVIEYELPNTDVIPQFAEFRYVKARDTIESKPRKSAEIKTIYQDVVAAIALRTIHEIFEADQANAIDTCCFNGFVRTVDPATGVDIQPHLISVRTTKEKFLQINLARVDKTTCLRNLGAQVSRHAAEAQPVKPIVEFDMADARFIDQSDMVSGLGSAPNLMDYTPSEFEHLVANLFGKMGLDSKLTRSSRDGGVDCIAYDPRPILGGKVVIQAKRYRHTVGVSAVRDLYGTMMNEGASKGILVATSGYGPDAFNFASDKPIELIDGGGLLFLLQEIGMQARIIFPTEP
ncbi:restriction endonuclease [Rhizobium lusitanum]|uniref:restriction endonuclease n=1 Tax=Rhizobium lusitanum TaxID=293958 RepID=UPI001620F738|nr:restriction endonuclease [Rhizobium lusitanum]QND47902.1 restriction endonuclease [Rhizobium lusitanum]